MYDSPERLAPRLAPPRKRRALPNALGELFRDHWLIAFLILAFLINLGLVTFLVMRFEGIDELIPLHFDAQGFPDRIESKNGIYGLPTIGFAVLAANAGLALVTHRRERGASVLLASSALLIQILLWLAALNIVGGLI